MRINFAAVMSFCSLLHLAAFAATENSDDVTKAHGRLATYVVKNGSSYSEAEADVAMSVYQSALSVLNGYSGILYESQIDTNEKIRFYEDKLVLLTEELDGLRMSIKYFRQNLAIIGKAHFGVVIREEEGGIKFTPKLFIPKLTVSLSVHTVLNGENDRNWKAYRFADANKYKAFSLSEEEYARFATDRNLFFEAFKVSRAENISLSIANSERRAAQLLIELEGLKSRKAEIIQKIEYETEAYIHARSAINLHQIREIKIAFQTYGNALNSQWGNPLEAKQRINTLLPTLDSKTAIWLANFLPESEFTVVTKKKRAGF